MVDIKSMNISELEQYLADIGQPKFRAKQIFDWLHKKAAASFDEMTNLPSQLRESLSADCYIANCEIECRFESKLDETVKYLFKLHDGMYIESVLMKYHHGYSICISTQVGCRMGCSFCASTMGGLQRSLTASEMLSQIMTAQRDRGIRISNVVLMGMGEPMDNFDNVMRFLELVGDPAGLGIGMRHISLSTCGHVDGIYKLMERDLQLTLSISLHAPTDEIRSGMMPINKRWGIDELITACKRYTDRTHRRISFEYAVIKDVNDSDECARALHSLLKGMLCHVNLIPANEVDGREHKRSDRVHQFCDTLNRLGLNATVRRTLGADIAASCGQLRQRHENDNKNVTLID